jgi:hypothetical protein
MRDWNSILLRPRGWYRYRAPATVVSLNFNKQDKLKGDVPVTATHRSPQRLLLAAG